MRKHGFNLLKVHASHGHYRIEGSTLQVQRFENKRYGMPPEWDIVEPDWPDRPLVTSKSLDDVMHKLARIQALLPRRADCPVKGAACGIYSDTMMVEQEDDDE